ncbi:hypothetical protein GCM10009863_14710 [Streptomyces axinellae]|uniref:Uncharacterized protein n=1 Tax=Streptomyces axinellae TaxID=552788 RepID=A0ABP6C5N4_9ACTN
MDVSAEARCARPVSGHVLPRGASVIYGERSHVVNDRPSQMLYILVVAVLAGALAFAAVQGGRQ